MSWKILYHQLCAKHVKLEKDAHTPVLFEEYNTNDYYYMINNNSNLIYSLDEMYELLKKPKPVDPFTTLPIKSWKYVKVSITK